ncbi:hypothetical protein [Microbacterium galbinum]|uniref:DUF2127 domain-containing protein n=1 Tax=Microbacterium galbinum TaxID=2851646 RepID=A0ABY4ISC6_9MICO|nr:hypothetical protein [Microbacterium galbinum]UPL15690.1 hypothetical protein KV396_14910 [Microbacterium galbinum]
MTTLTKQDTKIARSRSTTELRVAAGLLIAQGVLMEGLVVLGLIGLVAAGVLQQTVTENAKIFALPYLQDNLYLMMMMSGVFAVLRVIGGIALWRNRLWGLALSLINCAVTLVLMIFLLPAGIVDGVLSGGALVLILHGWLGRDNDGRPRLVSTTRQPLPASTAAADAPERASRRQRRTQG